MEFPTGSGNEVTLDVVADEISQRLCNLFLPDENGRRPCHGDDARYAEDPNFKQLILFYEYFHGDTGRGVGASHQTGWTALAASLQAELYEAERVTAELTPAGAMEAAMA